MGLILRSNLSYINPLGKLTVGYMVCKTKEAKFALKSKVYLTNESKYQFDIIDLDLDIGDLDTTISGDFLAEIITFILQTLKTSIR